MKLNNFKLEISKDWKNSKGRFTFNERKQDTQSVEFKLPINEKHCKLIGISKKIENILNKEFQNIKKESSLNTTEIEYKWI